MLLCEGQEGKAETPGRTVISGSRSLAANTLFIISYNGSNISRPFL